MGVPVLSEKFQTDESVSKQIKAINQKDDG